jgi:hypothetical protein
MSNTHAAPGSGKIDLDVLTQFHWDPQPKAQALVNELVAQFLARCAEAAVFADRLKHETGTRFADWIDHIQVAYSGKMREQLLGVGFSHKPLPGAPQAYVHEGAIFPTVVLAQPENAEPVPMRIALKVDWVADFVAANRVPDSFPVEGEPWSRMRRALAFRTPRAGELGATEMWVIERHGYRGFEIEAPNAARAMAVMKHAEAFRRRQREFVEDAEGFEHLHGLVDAAVAEIGRDAACDMFFFAEREYWQRRNRAAQVQYGRQNRLGMGWANHDHHTYRSGRQHFWRMISVLEKLGFNLRERFYAGHEAGWGAQVLEHPVTGITIFADVDMSPEELTGDFAHIPMEEGDELGTVGLWCGLHGDAMLQAGMHHLECQFDFQSLVDQLRSASINTMAPFTTFPFLRQAFTEGERWPVSELRLMRLVQSGKLTKAQAYQFRVQGGAIGSHLENLERNDGYKGFNQTGVSDIIARTDPRKLKDLALTGA